MTKTALAGTILTTVVLAAGIGCPRPPDQMPDADCFDAGSDAGTDDAGADAGSDGGTLACEPFLSPGAQGCAAGEKCAWVVVSDSPSLSGTVACVPDGTVAVGGTCARGSPGEDTGYDNCQAGAICIGDGTAATCQAACGLRPGDAACAAETACARFEGLWTSGSALAFGGACSESCDPLSQTHLVGGNPTSCGAGRGCFLQTREDTTIAVCATAGTGTHKQALVGPAYANACSGGFIPRRAAQVVSGMECAALCKAAPVYVGSNDGVSGRPNSEGGDATVLNWMSQPATCESAGGASVLPSVPGTGESCHFFWMREPDANSVITAFSNAIGWCFPHAAWAFDPDGALPANNSDPYPRCVNVTTSDVLPPSNGVSDALYFGCQDLPARGLQTVLFSQPALDRFGPFID